MKTFLHSNLQYNFNKRLMANFAYLENIRTERIINSEI